MIYNNLILGIYLYMFILRAHVILPHHSSNFPIPIFSYRPHLRHFHRFPLHVLIHFLRGHLRCRLQFHQQASTFSIRFAHFMIYRGHFDRLIVG